MLTKETKDQILKEYARSEKDTGSSEVQIALFQERIRQITGHLKLFPKDKHSRRGLVILIGKKNTFCKYLKRTNSERYEALMKRIK